MSSSKAIVLAAGKGTRMKSELPKVLHKVYDRCIIDYVCNACEDAGINDICIIVGHKAQQVKDHVEKFRPNVKFCLQEEQLGTGHAVMQAKDYIDDDDMIFVINGDQPLVSSLTIKSMISFCEQGNYGGAALTAIVDCPGSLGRIIRDSNGNLERIVEKKDCNEEEEKVKEVNIGVYCFKGSLLKSTFNKLDDNNAQNEYYITDIPYHIKEQGFPFGVFAISDLSEYQGINSREELSLATCTLLNKMRKLHMINGVTLIDPNNTYISIDAKIGKDTIIYPGTNIQGETIIGENCIIGPNSHIISSKIGNNVIIETSKVEGSIIENDSKIGPFANLRQNSNIGMNCKVGSFVETKKVSVGNNTKIPHHIYVGDAEIGNNVEIACGAITANMNANWQKNKTIIKDGAFIGSNSTLLAPVTIGENSLVAAGSVITDSVPDISLAIARTRQTTKDGYAKNDKYTKKR
ncbi:MAG: bifunctional UDP-N-acetylglucosamine diphosphorylase/glucosamine-1-phosphate N-acetyltransferase GlmU [Clostridia bacterium]